MTETPDTRHPTPDTRHPSSERRWMLLVALFTMLVTMLPYLIGWMGAQERVFMWLGYNLDDSCVYLSWMRQAADGSLRALNLFTTDPQKGMLLNPFFLALGWIGRLTHLPLIAVYHLRKAGMWRGLAHYRLGVSQSHGCRSVRASPCPALRVLSRPAWDGFRSPGKRSPPRRPALPARLISGSRKQLRFCLCFSARYFAFHLPCKSASCCCCSKANKPNGCAMPLPQAYAVSFLA